MFAPRYALSIGDLKIEMGPPRNVAEVEEYAELMSNPVVSRHLFTQRGYTVDDEREWYEKARTSKEDVYWLLFDVTEGERVLIGNTAYHGTHAPLKTAVSGFMIARPDYWGRGIAKHAHRVRTWHAFSRDGVVCLRSAVFEPNTGSQRALESVGYVQVGLERNQLLDDGVYRHKMNFECVNPDPYVWRQWWNGENIPSTFRKARVRTNAAIRWVRQEVKPLD